MDKVTTRETILVVDDAESVLTTAVAILKKAHFNVLQANTGAKAVELARDYTGHIDLLLSTIQTAEMTGPDLGTTIKKTRPDIHIMFMSGFDKGDLLVLNYGWSYIQKPSVGAKLLEMVNDVPHTPNKAQSTHNYDTRKDIDPDNTVEAKQRLN